VTVQSSDHRADGEILDDEHAVAIDVRRASLCGRVGPGRSGVSLVVHEQM
jgi:hypothetical protein